jgi:hypothetical protein
MAQLSYWRAVNRLRDIYEYNREIDPASVDEKDILMKSINEYIRDYNIEYDLVDLYQWIYQIKEKNSSSLEEALIVVGQEIYDRE